MYRGEPECYERVSSSLYRKHCKIEAEGFDIAVVQSEMLQEAKRFIREPDDDVILEQLQHFGYPTNQIDFTKDCNIALFFACYSHQEKDGRVILLNRAGRDDLKEPKTPENRVISQKSVFVRPPKGFVEPDDIIAIPKELKRPILEYLDKGNGVNASAVFNDIHGFIRYYTDHQSTYVEIYAGLSHRRNEEYSKAIERFTKAIEINPQLSIAYNNRGVAYRRQGDIDLAIQDYDRAIELNPYSARAYNNRGVAYRRQGNRNDAIQDFNKAIELNPDHARAYYSRGVAYRQQGNHNLAVQDFNKAIELNPGYTRAYYSRGFAYQDQGKHDLAIQDFNKAIELDPDYARAYYSRGVSMLCLEEWGNAESDLSHAQSLGFDTVSEFCRVFGSVEEFERDYNVQLPENIRAMLTPKQ